MHFINHLLKYVHLHLLFIDFYKWTYWYYQKKCYIFKNCEVQFLQIGQNERVFYLDLTLIWIKHFFLPNTIIFSIFLEHQYHRKQFKHLIFFLAEQPEFYMEEKKSKANKELHNFIKSRVSGPAEGPISALHVKETFGKKSANHLWASAVCCHFFFTWKFCIFLVSYPSSPWRVLEFLTLCCNVFAQIFSFSDWKK